MNVSQAEQAPDNVAGLEVKALAAGDEAAWLTYVQAHPSATVFHLPCWSNAVQGAYGHTPCHLLAWRQGQVVGVLPMFLVKSVFVGKVLVSIPYATYGGIVADDAGVARALLDAASALGQKHGTQYLELRHRDANDLALPELDRYDTFRKELPADPAGVLAGLPRKTRAAARKGLDDLQIYTGPEWLDAIYDLYAFTLRRLGSPNYRRDLFHRLQQAYGDNCFCLLVKDGDTPVSGVISYIFRDEIVPYFSGSTDEGMRKCANNAMYVRLMELAVERGLKWFDFNRSRRDNHGPHAFKRHHGFEPKPLHYQVMLQKAKELPNLSPSNGKYALAGRIWKKLPLWLTQPAGEHITKWIP